MVEALPKAEKTPRATGLQGVVARIGPETIGLAAALIAVMAAFSIATPRFLTHATFNSVAFQLPELGLLTLAMVMPIVSGGINLSVTFTANICGLALASVLHASGGLDAGPSAFLSGRRLPWASASRAGSRWA